MSTKRKSAVCKNPVRGSKMRRRRKPPEAELKQAFVARVTQLARSMDAPALRQTRQDLRAVDEFLQFMVARRDDVAEILALEALRRMPKRRRRKP